MKNLTFVSKFTSHGIKRDDFAFIHVICCKEYRKYRSLIKYVAVDLHKATFVVQGNYKCTITIAFHYLRYFNLYRMFYYLKKSKFVHQTKITCCKLSDKNLI